MGLFLFLIIVQTIVAAVMIALILMQRSEGGGLVSGGSPSGMMSARGAADLLTRSTAVLATLFVVLSIIIAGIAAGQRGPRQIDPGLVRQPPPAGAPIERQDTPFDVVPLGDQPAAPAEAPADPPAAPPGQ